MSEHYSLFQCRNLAFPPITDYDYPLARALETYLSSYDVVISQPIVLNQEQTARLTEIMAQPRNPLPGDVSLPFDE